ncbi:Dipeptide ABC transporter permease protein [Halorhabdus tiamatea SARL4B]|uniref:ABC-type dipeptide/oligopeptide/nickel transporter, permease components II n=1 Tax=Halorhabdus tiamatea SARL4B TaxID=1033806 RepID=F7PFA5_9EURY|nr:ABC transporter permease [Halorhabdus tiamatea]ERJ05735.1 Dipeptide ABC transporter permease protein [Halorhabdus tiamatea SARL4B]CCQ33941.1 ABC-type dipeptide/oligopeptide/nickel transporter, permease components II [Halorhabdus tiamatea SARL4B]
MSDTESTTTREELTGFERVPLRTRIAESPRPFLRWFSVLVVLIAVEFGTYAKLAFTLVEATFVGVTAFFELLAGTVSSSAASAILDVQAAGAEFLGGLTEWAGSLPTLFGRETIPNQGYQLGPGGTWDGTVLGIEPPEAIADLPVVFDWKGTFLGLEPALAWALRLTLIVAYAMFLAYWLFRGWTVFRDHYRQADWTPTDDMIGRLKGHRWGQFGILVLLLYLTMAIFGPALGPTTVEQNIQSSYSHEIKYFDEEAESVETIFVGEANFNSKSKGSGENVGPMTYDDFDRFHPFGTLNNGRDLFTFLMGGARITMIVAGMAIGIATLIAATLSMISAYYAGSVDLTILTTADGIVSVPRLILLIMVSAVFANHWLGNILDGGFILALVFAFTTWPLLWRAVRGPALQVAQEEWVDAARSFGQRPRTIMRKHMLPYIVGYLLVYASMTTGGIIISLSALSFLGNGLGISAPTPAWGRAVSLGQSYVATSSWHISLLSGLIIVVLVTGLNAFGDGIRDAIDPETESAEAEEAAAGGGA